MAVELTVQEYDSLDGTDFAGDAEAVDATSTTYANDGRVMLRVKNESGGDIVMTLKFDDITIYEVSPADPTVSIANGADETFGPFPVDLFGSTTELTFDDDTGVSILAYKMIPRE